MTPTNYSLWLMPEGDLYEELKRLVDSLAKENGTPPFLPHLTLLGSVSGNEETILEKSKLLASCLKPFEVPLKGIGMEEVFFRCLYLNASKNRILTKANGSARALFHKENEPDFMPHLSLMYGDFVATRKEEIIADNHLNDFTASFRAASLHLYSTTGEPESWESVGKFPFQ